MNNLGRKIYIFCSGTILLALLMLLAINLYQPTEKSYEIYKSALESYKKEDFSKSYYLFSKIIITSELKPLAIYHQGAAADKIEDTKSAIKQYRFFLLLYPNHLLSPKVRYNLGQDLVNTNPDSANKQFEYIIKKYPNTDYAIASEYFSGLIEQKKYEKDTIFPLSAKNEIQSHYRHYIKKAPGGKHAFNAVLNWEKLDASISKDDYLLMAKTSYLFNDYKKAGELADKAELKTSWPLQVLNSYAEGDKGRAKYLVEWGLNGNADYIDKEAVLKAIDTYMLMSPSKYQAAVNLLNLTKSVGKDYLTAIKCRYSTGASAFDCYRNLYLWYPNGDYADEAQAQMFYDIYRRNARDDAQRIGIDFLNKYKDSSKYAPMVMYYLGRVSENARAYRDYMSYYKGVISKYPDNYYAYRAYLRLNRKNSPIISSYIHPAQIEFPYDRSHAFLDKLVMLGDFEVLDEYARYDEFIKSWVLYKKGENNKAMLIARDAMDKLSTKPEKSDLRWRLVYPILYYDEIKQYADKYGNNAPLMLSIAREESYFKPEALSSVGAQGLMQLMPSTASDTASRVGLSNYNLSNPAQNIMLGNAYYSSVRSQLGGLDVSSVAAYNGGAGSVNVWKQSINFNDTDSFIEQIPYPETKNYVKKVFRSYWNYVRIYDGYN